MFNGNVPAIYKSNDGGENWNPLSLRLSFNPPFGPPGGNLLAIDSQSTLYAVIGTSPYKSSDGGVTFTQLSNAPPASLIAVDSATPSTLYLGTSNGLFRSTDGGASFSRIYGGSLRAIAVDPNAPETLYLSGLNPGILKSTDRGATWQPTGLAIPYVNLIAVDTLTPGRVYASTSLDPADVFVIKVVE